MYESFCLKDNLLPKICSTLFSLKWPDDIHNCLYILNNFLLQVLGVIFKN